MKKIVLFVIAFVFIFIFQNIVLADDWRIKNFRSYKQLCGKKVALMADDLKINATFIECLDNEMLKNFRDHFLVKDNQSLIWKNISEEDVKSSLIGSVAANLKKNRQTAKKILNK